MRFSKKLSWERINLLDRLYTLEHKLHDSIRSTPSQNTRTLNKLNKWLDQIDFILKRIDTIKRRVIPKLEKNLEIKLRDNEQVFIALFQPSTRNLFLEMKIHFENDDSLSDDYFDVLTTLSDRAELLALIGDAAISLSVIHYIWPPEETNAGSMTLKRAEIVSNEHMSSICDNWELYEHRIHFDPDAPSASEMNHDKGTLLEAIYGIIYLNHGYDKTRKLVQQII
ncbi:MAG: hypothetical protein BAJATHORv1_100073 [Candidatus Thorarchaeota archaeon]|nr:MAG: hypothetical protein BAJATHORv1_100073 [Candidatus Thorarchaeota archaeon]